MSAPEGESADPYIEDYEPYTTSMQFRVGQSAGSGRGLFASEALPQLTDLIDEVPLIAWPSLLSALGMEGRGDAVFCDTCLSVFSRKSQHITCSDESCGARFCSGTCAGNGFHRGMCGGALPALRAWQAEIAPDSHYGAESIARCNARIAQDVLWFSSVAGLPASAALANALRPWERFCAFPANTELDLKGASAEALAAALRERTLGPLTAALEAQLASEDACAIAEELTAAPHVTGLIQRLLLNTFQWQHPTNEHLQFAGMFLLTCNANHDCAPNAQVYPSWIRVEEADESEQTDSSSAAADSSSAAAGSSSAAAGSSSAAAGSSSVAAGSSSVAAVSSSVAADLSSAAAGSTDGFSEEEVLYWSHAVGKSRMERPLVGGARDTFSFVLRTVADVAAGEELTLCYVTPNLGLAERREQLNHWAFHCKCHRCLAEEWWAQAPPTGERGTKRKAPLPTEGAQGHAWSGARASAGGKRIPVGSGHSSPSGLQAFTAAVLLDNDAHDVAMNKDWPLGEGDDGPWQESSGISRGYVRRDGLLTFVGGIPRNLANKWNVGAGELGYEGEPDTAESKEEAKAALGKILESMYR